MKFESIVILTGAGISAESGLKTFRDIGGLWENYRIEDVATPSAFLRNPKLVYEFYNQRRNQLIKGSIKPNAAHLALSEFENKFKGNFTLITQNVDNLHEQAGSQNLLHMHGELLKARCLNSGWVFDWQKDLNATDTCTCCKPPENLRPHIVWFGEEPLFMEEIFTALRNCDLFVAVGTSGQVYPAAGFCKQASLSGAHTVELNLEPSEGTNHFQEKHHGKATETVPKFFEKLLNCS